MKKRDPPTVVGLQPDGKMDIFRCRIKRTYLLIGAFIFLGLLSLSLLITVIVQSQNSGSNESNNNDVCLTQGCISAATHQLRFIDQTASSNSCIDFYKYACGGWQQTHPIQSFDVERTIIGDIIDRRNADIDRFLNAPVSREGPKSWEYKLKTYYSECLNDYERVPDSGKYMIALIEDRDTIDGWFVFDNSAPNASQTELLKSQSVYTQISHIHGDLGVRTVFGLRTRFDETDPSIKRLEFFPAGLSMDVNDYLGNDSISQARRTAYQSYIIDVLGQLARDAGIADENLLDRTYTVANDVIAVETFLAESLRRNPTGSKPRTVTLKEMSAEFAFDFVGLMEHELGNSSIVSELTSVYLTNVMYFTDTFEYLSNADDPLFARLIHNYMRWRLIWTYIEDLSYDYVHTHRSFLDAYYGYALHSSNEAYCTREVIRRFPLAIQRLYTTNSIIPSNAITTVETIFNSLKNAFQKYINEQATWMTDEPTKRIAREKIDTLTAAIGYATIASNDAQLDNYYEKFNVGDSSHFQNAYSYYRFHRWSLSSSLTNPNILDHWDLFETQPNRLFDYIALFNRLFVIASGMHEPLVNSEWPWPVNMGSIGVLLAQKLFASIDGPEGRTHLANGTRVSDWWSSVTANAYNTSRNCITDYYVQDLKTLTYNINGAELQVQLAGEPFSPTTLRHIGALRFAYDALIQNDQIKSFKMPGTNFTREQTFFLAYAQTQCYQRQEIVQFVRTQLGAYDERTALNTALIHMPEFARAFQCTPKENQCF